MTVRRSFTALLAAVLACWLTGRPVLAGEVGFKHRAASDPAGPGVEVGLWYPTTGIARPTPVELFVQDLVPDGGVSGRGLPLVVISHGTGGDFASHADTALALAQAGFVVATLTHPEDNYRNESGALDVAGRARQFAAVISWASERAFPAGVVDLSRIGTFGFSAGGLTVLMEAGGQPDLAQVAPHCIVHPEFFDCRLLAAHRNEPVTSGPVTEAERRSWPKPRVLVIAAPALGFAFDRVGLARVSVPVQLWEAANDAILPNVDYADVVRRSLPHEPEVHVVPRAGHFDFLAPCSAELARVAPPICSSEPGFDRVAFHRGFDAEVVSFFERTLRSPSSKFHKN